MSVTPEQIAEHEEAADAIRARAAHLAEIASELEAYAEAEVADDALDVATRRLGELDQLLLGEVALPEQSAGIPGFDQIMEHYEALLEDD